MNKKNLPKAIRPQETRGAPQTFAQEAPGVTAAPTMAAASAPPPRKPAPVMAKDMAKDVAKPAAAPETPEAKDRRARATAVVKRLSLWSGAAGLIPIPLVDLAAVGGVQIEMLRRISKIYAVPFSQNSGKALIAGIAGSMIPASSGVGATSLIKGIPGIGTAVSLLTMPTLSMGATYAIGMAFIQHFATGGTLLDFNPPDYHEFLKAETGRGHAGAAQSV
jgi:uncharacterized protein (DUF697 family)